MTPAHSAPLGSRLRLTILGLGITQIIGWASTYYLLSLLGTNMGRDLGLSNAALLSGVSMTMVATALIGPRVGRWQDRAGSRPVMATGSAIIAAGLAIIALGSSWHSYFLGWLVISIGSPMALYSASFTALTQAAGQRARRAISFLTLVGGLASSIAWPVTAWLMTMMEWREIILLFAALNLLVCLPLHLAILSRSGSGRESDPASRPVEAGLTAQPQRRAFLILAVMLVMTGLVFNSWALLVFRLLEGIAFPMETAIIIGSLVGVWQVFGRFVEMLFAARFSVFWTGYISMAFLPLSFTILLGAGGNVMLGILFAFFFGISNGLMTLARSGLTLVIFGADGYGERYNRIQVAQNIAAASSPILAGMVLDRFGAVVTLSILLALSTAGFALMLALRDHCARHGLR